MATEVDTRPLSEKLADQIQPASHVLDLSSGVDVQIIGKAHDISRVKQACKEALRRIEGDRRNPNETFTVRVPARDTT